MLSTEVSLKVFYMKRLLRLVGLVGLVLGLSFCSGFNESVGSPATSYDGPHMARVANDATVALIVFDQGAFCSGVWVSPSIIMTASHCVVGYTQMVRSREVLSVLRAAGVPDMIIPALMSLDRDELQALHDNPGADPILKNLADMILSVPFLPIHGLVIPYTIQSEVTDVGVAPNKVFHSVAYYVNKRKDIALLRVDSNEGLGVHAIAKIADHNPRVGETIYATGMTHGAYWTFKTGVVSAYRHDLSHNGMKRVDGPFLEVEANLNNGDSGGGVFNGQGELVGISSFITDKTAAGYCVELHTLRSILIGQRIIKAKLDNGNSPDMRDIELNLQ